MKIVPTLESLNDRISPAGLATGTWIAGIRADWGTPYTFTGTGSFQDVASATVSARINTPGNVLFGHATGSVSFVAANGTVTLSVTGPTQFGFGAFPSSLAYKVVQATGAYAGDSGMAGTMFVSLVGTRSGTFTFTF